MSLWPWHLVSLWYKSSWTWILQSISTFLLSSCFKSFQGVLGENSRLQHKMTSYIWNIQLEIPWYWRHFEIKDDSWNVLTCSDRADIKIDTKQKNGSFIEGWVCSAGDSPDQGTNPVLSALWHCSGLVWSFALLLHWARKDQWRYKMF